MRRATLSNNSRRFVCLHFYPRSPCGERHPPSQSRYADTNFYPRSPCGERPYSGTNCSGANTYFYPRSPCGERLSSISLSYNAENFYPRSPCGERRGLYSRKACAILFLSTLSLRRATLCPPAVAAVAVTISIHALLAESDRCVLRIVSVCSEFLSTLSLRRATPIPA